MSQMIVTEVQTTFSPEELQEVSGLPAEIFNEIKDLGALDEFLDHGRYVSRSFLVIRKAPDCAEPLISRVTHWRY